MHPRFAYLDIECKHGPWRRKAEQAVLESQNPDVRASNTFAQMNSTLEAARAMIGVLPEAHAQLHGEACQVGNSVLSSE